MMMNNTSNPGEGVDNGDVGSYDVPIEMAVPVVGVGAFILALTLVFCVYQCLVRRTYRFKTTGYKKVVIERQGKTNDLDSLKCRMCVICLDSYKVRDVLALCTCGHIFHKKCLNKWLRWRLVCPMCMEEIRPTLRHHEPVAVGNRHPRVTTV